jgi:hypothetical protein
MSGFWESELGEVTGKAEDAFAKSITTVPDGTMALAKIESFVNDEFGGLKFLSVNWVLTEGDYRGAKVTQKLKVIDADPRDKDPAKTRHRGLNMMKLMYQLFNMKPKHANVPTDQDLAVFGGKIAGIKIRETEPNDQARSYNWVAEIHDAKGFKSETGPGLPPAKHTSVTNASYSSQGTIDSAFSRNNALPTDTSMVDDVPF